MNIDERLEAITQNIELLMGMQRDNIEGMRALQAAQAENGKHINCVLTIIERLTGAVQSHEQHLGRLEGQQ
jgi:hypothetical protein